MLFYVNLFYTKLEVSKSNTLIFFRLGPILVHEV